MKKCSRHLIAFFTFLIISFLSSAQQLPNPVTLYEHIDFTGSGYGFKLTEIANLSEWNNKISAIRVPQGYKMIAYDQANYQGRSIEITGDWTPANDMYWNDRIVSLRVVPLNTNTQAEAVWVKLYEHANFESQYHDVQITTTFVLTGEWNNTVSSIKVPAGYKLICYDNENLQGPSIEVSGDWTLNPGNMQWNDRISSIRLVKIDNSNAVINNTQPGKKGIRAYADVDFQGAYHDYEIWGDPNSPQLFSMTDEWNKKISSMQIPEGFKAIAYDQKDFWGNRIEITGNWSASNHPDWNDRISSLQLVKKDVQIFTGDNSNSTTSNSANSNTTNTITTSNNSSTLPSNVYVRLFENADFTGATKDFGLVDAIMGFGELTKKVSAIQIKEGYKLIVYETERAEGAWLELTQSWSANLASNWNDRIGSFRLMDKNKQFDPDQKYKQAVLDKPLDLDRKLVRLTTRTHGEKGKWFFYSVGDSSFYLKDSMASQLTLAKTGVDIYKMLVNIKGKYWAVAATRYAFPAIQEIDPFSRYQLWQIDKLPSGRYRITNLGLRENNSPYPVIYCSATNNKLFFDKWKQDSSANGQWNFEVDGPAALANELFENRTMSLISTDNKPVSFVYARLASEGYQLVLGESKDANARVWFTKTVNGDYFIRASVEKSTRSEYLTDRLDASYNKTWDVLRPNPKLTWNIIPKGNGTYLISNTASNKVIEWRYGRMFMAERKDNEPGQLWRIY